MPELATNKKETGKEAAEGGRIVKIHFVRPQLQTLPTSRNRQSGCSERPGLGNNRGGEWHKVKTDRLTSNGVRESRCVLQRLFVLVV